jgi:toxin ParE1/3/4
MSGKPIEYHEGAAEDVRNAVSWYLKRSPKAALDFIEELHRAIATIVASPHCWPEGNNSTRRFSLWRFPFAVLYSEQEAVIMIWAVAHGSRRPEYWADRS